jgi:hypothetical protein
VCKNPWLRARENGSRRGFASCCWAKCTRRAATAPGGGKSRKRTAAGGRPRTGRRCRIRAGFESEGRHLVLVVAVPQREVVQGAANDSVGAVVQRMERRYVAVPPHELCRCAGEVVGQLWRQLAAVLCLVAECSAALSVLENCSRKVLGGISGESKNWPGKMSGEPNTS